MFSNVNFVVLVDDMELLKDTGHVVNLLLHGLLLCLKLLNKSVTKVKVVVSCGSCVSVVVEHVVMVVVLGVLLLLEELLHHLLQFLQALISRSGGSHVIGHVVIHLLLLVLHHHLHHPPHNIGPVLGLVVIIVVGPVVMVAIVVLLMVIILLILVHHPEKLKEHLELIVLHVVSSSQQGIDSFIRSSVLRKRKFRSILQGAFSHSLLHLDGPNFHVFLSKTAFHCLHFCPFVKLSSLFISPQGQSGKAQQYKYLHLNTWLVHED